MGTLCVYVYIFKGYMYKDKVFSKLFLLEGEPEHATSLKDMKLSLLCPPSV